MYNWFCEIFVPRRGAGPYSKKIRLKSNKRKPNVTKSSLFLNSELIILRSNDWAVLGRPVRSFLKTGVRILHKVRRKSWKSWWAGGGGGGLRHFFCYPSQKIWVIFLDSFFFFFVCVWEKKGGGAPPPPPPLSNFFRPGAASGPSSYCKTPPQKKKNQKKFLWLRLVIFSTCCKWKFCEETICNACIIIITLRLKNILLCDYYFFVFGGGGCRGGIDGYQL